MLISLGNAQQQVASHLDELRLADSRTMRGDLIEQGNARLQQLNHLRDQLAGGVSGLPAAVVRAIVASALADVHAFASEARSATGQSTAEAQAALQSASDAARAAVAGFQDDYFNKRIFDPYLRFASDKDEEAYRQREQERQREIAEALAEHTPEGDLRANELAIDQLKDAGAHGADRSKDYQPKLDGLEHTRKQLEEKLAASHNGPAHGSAEASTEAAAAPTADSPVPPDVVAILRAAKVAVGDHSAEGHGVTTATPQQANALMPG
ncbi:MAG: hypothetical protein WDM86_08760 [Rhizomicrobium sp.]